MSSISEAEIRARVDELIRMLGEASTEPAVLLETALFVEEVFGLTLEDADMTAERLGTGEAICILVRERLLSGAPPTVREVQEAFGFRSVETAREHLEGLVREGRLDKRPGRARGYRLPSSDGPPTVMVPLLGRVPAGSLDTAVEVDGIFEIA